MTLSAPTSNHDLIRSWAVAHNAVPAELPPDSSNELAPGLRFLFLDGTVNSQNLQPVSWEEFFARLDSLTLLLAYDRTGSATRSQRYRFYRDEASLTDLLDGNSL